MPKISHSVINYKMYEGTNEFVGMAQVTLPSLQFMTTAVRGAGIAGEVSAVLIGQMQAMTMQIQMLTLSKQGIDLAEPREHTWEFHEAQQEINPEKHDHVVEHVKHVIKAYPSQMDGGTLQPQSASNPNITASVYYWAEYRDGQKVLELDPLNYICFFNGTDYLAPVRAALGM